MMLSESKRVRHVQTIKQRPDYCLRARIGETDRPTATGSGTYQILTCVGVRLINLASCSRSGADRYLCVRKRRSSSVVCDLEKRTRRLRFLLLL